MLKKKPHNIGSQFDYVGNFYFIIVLECEHNMYLKTTNINGFHQIYDTVLIEII